MPTDPAAPPPEHTNTCKLLRRVGLAALVLGVLLAVLGIGSFMFSFIGAFSSNGEPSFPVLFPLAFVGMPLLFVGAACLMAGYTGAVSKYIVREQVPAAAEGINRLVPATLGSLRGAASAVGHGLRADGCACAKCGESCDADARFCDRCGAPTVTACSSCNAPQDSDAKFCDACGAAMPAAAADRNA